MHRNLCERDIRQADVRGLPFHCFVSEEIVEPVIREVDIDGGRVLFKNWADKNAWAEKELELYIVCFCILGVLEEQRLKSGCSVRMLLVEGRVEIVEQTVAKVDGVLRRFGDQWPAVEFLRGRGVAVMVAVERIECPECGPSSTQRLSCVPSESASV